jgi:hypothetical protein
MPLILAGLLALVSLVGIMTMRSPATADHSGSGGRDRGTSIATDPGGEALTDQQDDGAFEGGRPPPVEPQSDESPLYDSQRLEATDSAPSVDGDDSEGPGKSEEAPGHPRTPDQYDSQRLEATDSATSVDGDNSEGPGKSEEAPGHPRTPGQSQGRGQEKADENGQGPINEQDNSSTRRD